MLQSTRFIIITWKLLSVSQSLTRPEKHVTLMVLPCTIKPYAATHALVLNAIVDIYSINFVFSKFRSGMDPLIKKEAVWSYYQILSK